MKGKILSILFALVLVVSFSLVAAVPAAASPASNGVDFETWGDGEGSWSDTPTGYAGSYCVKLSGPMIVRVPYGETFETLAVVAAAEVEGQQVWDIKWRIYDTGSLQLHAKIYLDTDHDSAGAVDTVLTGGYGATTDPSPRVVDAWINAWMGYGSAWQMDTYDDGVWTSGATVGTVTYGASGHQLNQLLADATAGDTWKAATVVYIAYGYAVETEAYVDDITVAGVPYEVDPAAIVDGTDTVLPTVPDGTSFYLHVTSSKSNTHPAAVDTLSVTLDIYDGDAVVADTAAISTAVYTATETGKDTSEFWTDAISTTDLGVRPGYKLVSSWEGGSLPVFIRAEVSFDKSYYDIGENMTITVKDDTANISAIAKNNLGEIIAEIAWWNGGWDPLNDSSFLETGEDTGVFTYTITPSDAVADPAFDVGDTMEIHYENSDYGTTDTLDDIDANGNSTEEVKATAHVLMYSESSVAFDHGTYAVTATSATVTVTDPDKGNTITGADCLVVENLTTDDSVSFSSLSGSAGVFDQTVTFGTGTGKLAINDGDTLKATYTDPATPEDVSTATAAVGYTVFLYEADGTTLNDSYTTIEDAISDAATGWTVKVSEAYNSTDEDFPITISKTGLTVESVAGATSTIIDASEASADVVEITANNVTFDGFTVQDTPSGYSAIKVTGTGATVINNIMTAATGYPEGIHIGASEATVSGNELDIHHTMMVISGSNIELSENTFGAGINLQTSDVDILDNEIIGSEYTGIVFEVATINNILIDGNTISGTTQTDEGTEGIGIAFRDVVTDVANLQIINNDITDNEGPGIVIPSGVTTLTDPVVIKFNTISGNTDYGIENASGDSVDATHNWWGDVSGPGDAVSADITYDPWLDASVSVGAIAPGEASLDAETTVGVKVTGVAGSGAATVIGAALYSTNPKGTPTFTPLDNGFFDVFVKNPDAGGTTSEIILKFSPAGIDENSVVYAWNELYGIWEACTLQDFSSYGGYIWVKVHSELADVVTVPTIEALAGLPFAISTEEAPPEFDPWEYDVDDNGEISKTEALTAVTDYFDDVITKAEALEVIALYFAS